MTAVAFARVCVAHSLSCPRLLTLWQPFVAIAPRGRTDQNCDQTYRPMRADIAWEELRLVFLRKVLY
jgi:hypothetical protein